MDIMNEALLDSVKLLPFLFLAYLFIEWYDHKANQTSNSRFISLQRFGPFFGAIVGCIPQCGFSVMAASLFGKRVISAGTLVAVFISTSDEAIPILFGHPEAFDALGFLVIIKIFIGMVAGFVIDRFWKISLVNHTDIKVDCSCDGEHSSIWLAALKRTATIFIFLFLINLGLSYVIDMIGDRALASLLLSGSLFQPIIASIIGFIPNCGASVLLTQLYLIDSLSLGSLLAGLISSAGLGLLMLLKSNPRPKENLSIILLVFVIGSLSGVLIQLFGF